MARLLTDAALRSAIDRALEALEAGNVDEAAAILLGVRPPDDPGEARCPSCGLDCRFPGRLADHLRIVHWWAEAE